MIVFSRRWQTLTLCSLIFIISLSVWPPLVSRLFSNLGYLSLENALVAPKETTRIAALGKSEQLLLRAETWSESNLSAVRGMGFTYWQRGNDKMAFTHWQQTGTSADEYIIFGALAQDEQTALRWYRLAEYLAPDDQALWFHVGRACQGMQDNADICVRFLNHNSNNQFVDPGFEFGHSGWSFNRQNDAVYEITDCPDQRHTSCANVTIEAETPTQGASWHQCLFVEGGADYIYSAWVKVDVTEDGQWRPLYYQGDIDSVPKGRWPGTREGPLDWTYLQTVVTMDSFDQQWACFHPLRLESKGEAWFRGASLEKVGHPNH